MDTNVVSLHRALVKAVRRARGESFDRPVTVAEIYQQLLPYRAARDAVGFEMNADYEYALLRLLAGEGDLARLEPSEARDTLRMELDSPNPNVSLFRDYAACDVWLTPADADVDLEATRAPHNVLRFTPELVAPDEDEIEIELDDQPAVVGSISAGATRTRQCAFCGGDLPAGRLINFCPNCGNDLTHRPCATCGEIMEPMWRFCINCGSAANGFDSEAN
jgi:hypothetical protein